MPESYLPFRISAGLKNIIGRDLITDDYVAVFELVKNAYDARAHNVFIEFTEDKIVIEDDGKGMDLKDIKDKWLFVAYSAKKEGTEDKEEDENDASEDYRDKIKLKRYYAGAKGIGRFSCDRLGNKLSLVTRNNKEDAKPERIKIDWRKFDEDAEKEFLDIKVQHTTLSTPVVFCGKSQHGTRLEISLLNAAWNREKKQGLKKSLEKLINPFESEDVEALGLDQQTFHIFLIDEKEKVEDNREGNLREKVNGEVRNFIFEKLNLNTSQIKVSIDEEGKGITSALVDRGTEIYKIRKTNDTVPKLKNIRFHLFFLNQAAKSAFTKTVGVQPIHFGSIFLYKNGFRIAPFGDAGDDSFGVDTRHVQNVFRTFGLRDIIGRIEIFGENDELRETSSRNGGLIKNEHLEALRKCFIESCLMKLEDYVTDVAWKIKEDKNREDVSLLDNLTSKGEIFKLIRRELEKGDGKLESFDKNFIAIKAQSLANATREAIENLKFIAEKSGDQAFAEFTTRTTENFERIKQEKEELEKRLKAEEEERLRAENELRLEQEKNTYLLATRKTLSKDAEGLIHNIKFTTNKIRANVDMLVDKITSGEATKQDILLHLGKIRTWSDKALKISELITRANFKTKVDRQVIDIVKFTEQYFALFNDIFEKEQIQFEVVSDGSSFEYRVGILDLSVVFDNFVFNSEKAGATKMVVQCSNPSPQSLSIVLADNGHGVSQQFLSNPEKMFELGVTTTDGSGIGLFSVRESIRSLNAKVRFIGNNHLLEGAAFEITFQK
ncbi:MAG: sensor histidine kinase [Bacteroidetes bacterium]|nr:sensor histidine kinase [Bacteroidota bacterium]